MVYGTRFFHYSNMGRFEDYIFGKIPGLLLDHRLKIGYIQNDTEGIRKLGRLCGMVPL